MMSRRHRTGLLVAWHSVAHGTGVLVNAVAGLRRQHGVEIDRILYLTEAAELEEIASLPAEIRSKVEAVSVSLRDPTSHRGIYEAMKERVLPLLDGSTPTHINVSPGTPAMHSVWLVLHAGGNLPTSTRLWSSQLVKKTGLIRVDPVDFPISTYLAEVREAARLSPGLAVYEPEAKSSARREALERLARYARVGGAPLLVLGERGTGKSRLVEVFVPKLKQRPKIVSLTCGGIDPALAESIIFGHQKGAFTGAIADRDGLLAEAHKGILFLDEVQDLPRSVQRKLVRVFQDRRRRYRRVGDDEEREADVEVVCASNVSPATLAEKLDADFFDRIGHLVVEVPPLRRCREDLHDDWRRVLLIAV